MKNNSNTYLNTHPKSHSNNNSNIGSNSHSIIYSKISKISHRFSLVFKCLLVLYPFLVMAPWFGIIDQNNYINAALILPVDVKIATLRWGIKLPALLLEFIPAFCVMLSLYYLIKLFQLYANNIIFSYQNVFLIRKIASVLFLEVLLIILVQPFLSLILTMDAPKGGHIISIGAGSPEITTLIIAGIAWLVSWIMEEGRKLEEETALTV